MSESTRQLPSDPSSAAVGDPAAEVGTSHRAGWSDTDLGDADLPSMLARMIARADADATRDADWVFAAVQRANAVELAKDRLVDAVRKWAAKEYGSRCAFTINEDAYAVLDALRAVDVAKGGTDA